MLTDLTPRSPFENEEHSVLGGAIRGAVLGVVIARFLHVRRDEIAVAPVLFWTAFWSFAPAGCLTIAAWAGVRYHPALAILAVTVFAGSLFGWRVAVQRARLADTLEVDEPVLDEELADDETTEAPVAAAAEQRWAETRPVRHAEITESGTLIRDRRSVDPEEL